MDDNRLRFEARLRELDEIPSIYSRASGTRERGLNNRDPKNLRRKVRPLRSLVRYTFLFIFLFATKAGFAEYIGTERYDDQVAVLSQGEGWQPLVALFMQRGPALKWASPGVSKVMGLEDRKPELAAFDWPQFMQVKGETGQ